jgi:hypothetical protein
VNQFHDLHCTFGDVGRNLGGIRYVCIPLRNPLVNGDVMRQVLPVCRVSAVSLLIALIAVLAARPALAGPIRWIDPTPDELKMTSEPKAPGAPAIVLSYEESDDADSAEVIVHVRVKVLTEGGLSAGTVELPDRVVRNDELEQVFFARTIHPDGTIVEFKGTPENSKKVDEYGAARKVIAMPSVTVGSILEYGYHFQSQNTIFTYLIGYYAPTWHVQRQYFVRSAHFVLHSPTPHSYDNPWLKSYDQDSVRWMANLPKGASIAKAKGRFELDVHDVPARSEEEYMPPLNAAVYNVRFFYYTGKQDQYWGESGARVDDSWLDFDKPTRLLKDAVAGLVLPGDNDETRLHKLYNAVQQMDNTDLSREHSTREDKAEGLKTGRNADTIWTNKRGASDELALLFVALARAAGYQAYPMAVASRNWAVFDQGVLSWDQMDDIVAIVSVNGRDIFFDPGTKYCPFTRMAPWHANATGVSTEAKLVKIRMTPEDRYDSNRIDRLADLTLTPDGGVTGTVKVAWAGLAGLSLRREGARQDAHAVEKTMENQLQSEMPEGVEVKFSEATGLTDPDAVLLAEFAVSGKLGSATGKRLILPAHFFAASSRRLLVAETRTLPLMFPEAYVSRDRVVTHLPTGLSVEAMPENHTFNMAKDVVYQSSVQSGTAQQAPGQQLLVAQRTLLLNRIDYKPEEYPELHKYFGNMAGTDQEQVILKNGPVTASTSTPDKPAGN